MLEPGTVLGVRGPSGGGKSTLLDLLLGLRTPDEGRVAGRRGRPGRRRPRRLAAPDRLGAAAPGAASPAPSPTTSALGRPVATAGTGRGRRRGGRARHPARHPGRRGRERAVHRSATSRRARPGRARRPAPPAARRADRRRRRRHRGAILAALDRVTAGRTVVLVSHRPEVLAVLRPGAHDRPRSRPGRPGPGAARAGGTTGTGGADPRAARLPLPPVPPRGRTAGALRWSLDRRARPMGTARAGCAARRARARVWGRAHRDLGLADLRRRAAAAGARADGRDRRGPRVRARQGRAPLRRAARSPTTPRCAPERPAGADLARAGAARAGRYRPPAPRRAARPARRRRRRPAGPVGPRRACPPRRVTAVGVVASAGHRRSCCRPQAPWSAAGLLLAGVVAPAVTVWAAHRAERRTAAAARRRCSAARSSCSRRRPTCSPSARPPATARASSDADRAPGRRCCDGPRSPAASAAASGCWPSARRRRPPPRPGSSRSVRGVLPGPALAVLALTPLAARRRRRRAARRRRSAAHRAARGAATGRARDATVPGHGARPSGRRRPADGASPPAGSPCAGPAPTATPSRAWTCRCGAAPASRSPGRRAPASRAWWRRCCARSTRPPGAVLADGRDVRDLAGDTVRDGIAWCGAATHLFDNTLRANLLLASPTATDDELAARPATGPARQMARQHCPTGSTPRSVNTAGRSPAANANGSAWPARCSPTGR